MKNVENENYMKNWDSYKGATIARLSKIPGQPFINKRKYLNRSFDTDVKYFFLFTEWLSGYFGK
jgi:hypothetical protein